ncbi:hypothetical protein GCM10009647_000020 [Streptomyces sanglieri]
MDPNIDPQTRLEQLFDHETTEFDLDYAFLSHIDIENETKRLDIAHGSHKLLKPGTTIPLSKTYCRKTIADPEGTLAVSDALAEGWDDDPAYETFELGSYLGTTVSVDDELYGTLCFADTTARDEPINDKEKALIEMYGQWVEYTLDLWDGPQIRGTGLDTIEERAVSPEAIGSMMDALRERTRRVILMTLLGDTTETSLATLERQINDENAQVQLFHSDLPRLANAGYIKWDDDSENISKGPRFSEVEPLVQLLREYNTRFPQ